jgi:glycosyltransferase involved in cell wall biosynthesis
MKARIVERIPEITLSVSMIVKDEEKNLPSCLEALKPLLEQVKSELIIVDTGSTDSTVEIAKKYTDKVLHFEWINDFSAARNFGLKKCTGEWFMFLDADEVFDADLSEMINFFNNREVSKNYNSAAYQLNNYTNLEKTTWTTFAPSRIVRLTGGTRFVNKIHECFSRFPEPAHYFNTFAWHSGYVHETEEQREAKLQRNLNPIKEQAKKMPKDVRTLLYLFFGLQDDEKEACLIKILETARTNKKDSYSEPAFLEAVRYYYAEDNFTKSVDCANESLKLFEGRRTALLLDICAIKASALSKQEKIAEAVETYELYLKYYDLYLAGRLDKSPAGKIPLIFNDSAHHKLIKTRVDELKSKI